jgi:Domain of unknown function (DUF5668)
MDLVGEGRRISRLVGGVLLLFLGTVFVLQNLGYVRAGRLADYWPLLLVWVGLTRMLSRQGTVASGFVIFALGVFFQLDRLDVIFVPMRLFWPALLIVIGFGLIADAVMGRRVGRHVLPRESESRPESRS